MKKIFLICSFGILLFYTRGQVSQVFLDSKEFNEQENFADIINKHASFSQLSRLSKKNDTIIFITVTSIDTATFFSAFREEQFWRIEPPRGLQWKSYFVDESGIDHINIQRGKKLIKRHHLSGASKIQHSIEYDRKGKPILRCQYDMEHGLLINVEAIGAYQKRLESTLIDDLIILQFNGENESFSICLKKGEIIYVEERTQDILLQRKGEFSFLQTIYDVQISELKPNTIWLESGEIYVNNRLIDKR